MSITKLAGKGRSHGYTTCTTVSGATESSVADLEGYANYGLLIPDVVDGSITFKVSNIEDGTFYTAQAKDGTDFTLTSGIDPCAIESDDLKALAGYRYVKIVSTAQTSLITFIWTVKG